MLVPQSQRASEVFSFPLGTVLERTDPSNLVRTRYVFLGWAETRTGTEAVFARSIEGLQSGFGFVKDLTFADAEVLLRVLPGAKKYIVNGDIE